MFVRSNRVDPELLRSTQSQMAQSIAALSEMRPLLLVFLRHFGCTFCREAVAEIAEKRPAIEAKGTRLAFVHVGTEEKAQWFFKPYALLDVPRFSDPEGHLYRAFGLERAELRQYLNLKTLWRAFDAYFHGHTTSRSEGDVLRMPGTFLLQNGEIRKAFRHKLVSDRPDYLALATPD